MSKPEIIETKPMNVVLVREALKKIRKRDNDELNFRATRTEEYVNAVAKLKQKEAKELVEKLEGLQIPRLKPEYIHKIVDVMPASEKHLKVVLQGYALAVSGENQKKIFETVQEYLPKKKGE
jgi:DNA-directed RNA polymerase subunit F